MRMYVYVCMHLCMYVCMHVRIHSYNLTIFHEVATSSLCFLRRTPPTTRFLCECERMKGDELFGWCSRCCASTVCVFMCVCMTVCFCMYVHMYLYVCVSFCACVRRRACPSAGVCMQSLSHTYACIRHRKFPWSWNSLVQRRHTDSHTHRENESRKVNA